MPARAWQETDGTFQLGALRECNKEAIYNSVAGMRGLTRDSKYLVSKGVGLKGRGGSGDQKPEGRLPQVT